MKKSKYCLHSVLVCQLWFISLKVGCIVMRVTSATCLSTLVGTGKGEENLLYRVTQDCCPYQSEGGLSCVWVYGTQKKGLC